MRRNKLIFALGLVGLVAGSFGLWDRLVNGHTNAAYGSYVPWGLWVAQYIYFMGLSSGAFLLSTLVYVFDVRRFERLGKLALFTALVTLVSAMFSIWLDLGHPGRAWKLLVQTNFGSIMGWMLWFYTTYLILLTVQFWLAIRADLAAWSERSRIARFLTFGRSDVSEEGAARNRRLMKIIGSIGIPLAISFSGGVGALFGVVGARPYWNSGLTPIMFVAGALLSGSALVAFLTALFGPDLGTEEHRERVLFLGKIVFGLLALYVLLEWAEYSVIYYASIPAHYEALRLVLFGDFWWTFWLIHVVAGIVIPAVLLMVARRSVAAVATASALVAFTFISVRLNIVIPALALSEIEGLKEAFTGPGLSFDYFPTPTEWLFTIWVISVAVLAFMAGIRWLPVVTQRKEILS